MKRNKLALFLSLIMVAMIFVAFHSSPAQPVGAFKVTNLIGSPGAGASKKDKNMINAWGNAFIPGGNPFWINDEGTGVSELIDGKGVISKQLPLVKVPGANGKKGEPTGIVANINGGFSLSTGGSALFIFDSEDGTISGWNSGSTAVIAVDNSGNASYTGLALAKNGNAFQLYAANQGVSGHPGSIDVFDSSFQPVTPSGGFIDQNLSKNFQPYNIAAINGNLFVAYSQGLQPVGQVDEFDPNGTLIMTFTRRTLGAPWGLTLAPPNFGAFSNDLLVGNLADGTISAFNPTNGEFLGQLADMNSKKIVIAGLWSLVDGAGAQNAPANTIYFTAGPKTYAAGLFGMIQAITPKPTKTPKPTRTPKPTKTPKPTRTPAPTRTPKPKKTPGDPHPTPTYVFPY